MKTEIEQLFYKYYAPLCNYASRIIADDVVAEDIVQNLFVQLWENNKFGTIKQPERFLLRAIKFKSIDYLRSQKTKIEVPFDEFLDHGRAFPNELREEDIEPLLHYFAAKLPEKTQVVFLLSRKSGLTYKEIAEELNISVKTVENQMGRALRMMRDLLKEQNLLALLFLLKI